jgi:hypothetical protein
MHFLIDIEFTKTLDEFKQRKFVDLFMICNCKLFFNLLNLIFVNSKFWLIID